MSVQPTSIDSLVPIRGTNCMVHRWNPPLSTTASTPRALVVIFHGCLDHGAHPSVRYAAEFLAEAGYVVVATDFPGHGRSEGLRGYFKNAMELIDHGVAQTLHAQSLIQGDNNNINSKTLPLVLCGFSMGGAVALSVANHLKQDKNYQGKEPMVILMSPMLNLKVSSLVRTTLQCLSVFAPTAPLFPISDNDTAKQYRDETKRAECESDELAILDAKMRVATALTLVDVVWKQQGKFASITSPLLLLVADEDIFVNKEDLEEFFQASASCDKIKKNYPALHGLMCEPSPLFEKIKGDILTWLSERV